MTDRTSTDPADGLPARLTSFVGRERELTELQARLQSGPCSVTLWGPPGVGKTRLAREAVRSLGGSVIWVDLHAVRTLSDVIGAMAVAASAEVLRAESPADALERVARSTAGGPVVLDNAEHVVEVVARVVSALQAVPGGARVLVTSRERLGVYGEVPLHVAPMAVPPDETALEAAASYDAVRLFHDRIGRLAVDLPDREACVRIVRTLGGNALAIELCASRVADLGFDVVEAEIARGRTMRASRRGQVRWRSLEEAVDWSWQLLAPEEQELASRLSVVEDLFDLEICAALGDLDLGVAGDVISALIAKSIVQGLDDPAEQPGRRFRMPREIRSFLRGRLEPAQENDCWNRYREHVLDRCEQRVREGEPYPPEGDPVVERCVPHLLEVLAREGDGERGRPEHELRAIVMLTPHYLSVGPLVELVAIASAALTRSSGAEIAEWRARAAAAACRAAIRAGRAQDLAESAKVGVEAARASGDPALLAWCEADLASAAARSDDTDHALRLVERVWARVGSGSSAPRLRARVALTRALILSYVGKSAEAIEAAATARGELAALDDLIGAARVDAYTLATYLDMGRVTEGLIRAREAATVLSRVGDKSTLFWSQVYGAYLADAAGETARAMSAIDNAQGVAEELGSPLCQAVALAGEGWLRLRSGDRAAARSAALGALAIAARVGDSPLSVEALSLLAVVAETPDELAEMLGRLRTFSERGEPERMITDLLSAALELRRSTPSSERASRAVEQARDAVRRARALPSHTARMVAQEVEALVDEASTQTATLTVEHEGRWVSRDDDEPVDLTRRGPIRRLVLALAENHAPAPGVGLSTDELFALGWPGESAKVESARARVYVSLRRLRELGLDGLIRTQNDGFCIDPSVVVRIDSGR